MRPDIQKENSPEKQQAVERFLRDNGYCGCILYGNGNSHCVLSDNLVKNQPVLDNAIETTAGLLKVLIENSKDKKKSLYPVVKIFDEFFRTIDPKLYAQYDADRALLDHIKKNSNDKS